MDRNKKSAMFIDSLVKDLGILDLDRIKLLQLLFSFILFNISNTTSEFESGNFPKEMKERAVAFLNSKDINNEDRYLELSFDYTRNVITKLVEGL